MCSILLHWSLTTDLSIREDSVGRYKVYNEQDVFATLAGDIVNIARLLHAVVTDNGQSPINKLQSNIINLLKAVDKLPDCESDSAIRELNSPGQLINITFGTVCMINDDF